MEFQSNLNYNKYIPVTDAYVKKMVMQKKEQTLEKSDRAEGEGAFWRDLLNEVCDKKFETRMKIEALKKKMDRLEKRFANLESQAQFIETKIK